MQPTTFHGRYTSGTHGGPSKHGSRGPEKTTSQDWVELPMGEFERISRFVDENGFAYAFMQKLKETLLAEELDIQMKRFDQEVELPPQHHELIRQSWTPFASKFIEYMWLFGVVVVNLIPSSQVMGELIPHVVPYTKYMLRFAESSEMGRQWFVHYNDTTRYDSDYAGIQANQNNIGFPLPNGGRHSLIFSLFEPSERGVLRAPFAILSKKLAYVDWAIDDEGYAGRWRARPLHSVEVTKNFQAGAPEALGETDTFAEGEIEMEDEKFRFRRNQQEQSDFKRAVGEAHGTQPTEFKTEAERQMAMLRGAAPAAAGATNPHSKVSPLRHFVVMGVNQHLAAGPTPQGHDNLQVMLDTVFKLAFAVIGMPPQEMDPSGTKLSEEGVIARRSWDTKVKSAHGKMSAMFSVIYMAAYVSRIGNYANDFYKVVKGEMREVTRRGQVYSADDEDMKKIQGILNPDEKRTIESHLKGARKTKIKEAIFSNLKVNFLFYHMPSALTFEQLVLLVANPAGIPVIDDDTFSEMAARLAGVTPEKVLDKAGRKRINDERLKQQHEQQEDSLKLQAKYEIKKGPEGVPSAAKKPKTGGGGEK